MVNKSSKKRRLALRLAYDGGELCGWQRQPGKRTVQGLLEEALVTVGLPGRVQGAARTDAGVHALEMFVHLDTAAVVADFSAARRAVNEVLPADIRLWSIAPAPRKFNARWSSRGKIYTYILATPENLEAAAGDPFLATRAWCLPDPRSFPHLEGQTRHLDTKSMSLALKSLLGRRNFAGLATLRGARVRGGTIRRLGASRVLDMAYPGAAEGRLVCITVSGDAFLKHMVRNMTGLLVQVGYGEIEASEVAATVSGRDRHQGPRAPGRGLTLVRVRYPSLLRP